MAVYGSYLYGMMLQPRIPSATAEPVLLFSGSYLVGLVFALSCITAREALIPFTQRLRKKAAVAADGNPHRPQWWFLAAIWEHPGTVREIFAVLFDTIVVVGCALLSMGIRGLVFWVAIMGAIPPLLMATTLARRALKGHPPTPWAAGEVREPSSGVLP